MVKISIVEDFSRTPGPRYISEGEFSGQLFRQTILLPKIQEALKENDDIQVDLDRASGYGTSFLEEAFGGLIREDHIPYDFLKTHLKIKSDEDDIYIQEINTYIESAYKKESDKKSGI